MKRLFFLLLIACVACVFGGSSLLASDAAQAKARMRDRVGEIDRLKLAEALGENNRGFLEARKPEGAAVADAENRDRAAVFNDTAGRTGASPDAVGRAFAKQVAAASAPGVWIQREDGSWVKK